MPQLPEKFFRMENANSQLFSDVNPGFSDNPMLVYVQY